MKVWNTEIILTHDLYVCEEYIYGNIYKCRKCNATIEYKPGIKKSIGINRARIFYQKDSKILSCEMMVMNEALS